MSGRGFEALGERLAARQWAGVAIGLAGVALIVWHKLDVREATAASLVAITVSLAGVTAGTLHRRHRGDLSGRRPHNLSHFCVQRPLTQGWPWISPRGRGNKSNEKRP